MPRTHSQAHVIRLAYETVGQTPAQEEYRRGERKKSDNPAQNAPLLNRVITHLDMDKRVPWAVGQAKGVVVTPEAMALVGQLTTIQELRQFLATLGLFLRTTETRERRAMKAFVDGGNKRLSPAEAVARAWQIATDGALGGKVNKNKLTRLAGRIRGSRDKWECLAVLAQYYPLKDVPEALINRFVEELGQLDVASFQAVVNQTLVFHKAGVAAQAKPNQTQRKGK